MATLSAGVSGRPAARSWRDRLAGLRDEILASQRFQYWAARFPLTRPIARRRSRAVFDLCAGFVYAQVLAACIRLRLFELLREGPLSGVELAERMGLQVTRAERLLAAAISLRLVSRRHGGRYGLGALGAAMVDNPGIAAMVEHHDVLYADLRDPVALLRGESNPALAGFWPYAGTSTPQTLPPGKVTAYTRLMATSQSLVAAEILGAARLHRYRCLLDIGGGDGSFLVAAATRAPALRLMLFDLPPVAEIARRRLAEAGLSDRASVFGGDFHSTPLPPGADLVSLVRVIHDHDDAQALAILRAARSALPPEGTLLLAEPMAGAPGAEPVGEAYFGFYLLAMGSGRARTPAELTLLLRQAGFHRIRLAPTGNQLLTSVLLARPNPAMAGPFCVNSD